MAAGGHVSARPGVGLLHVARGEHLLVLHEHDAGAVAPGFVGPYTRQDVVDRVDDVLVAVVAQLAVGTLRGIAADRQRGVDEELEPVDGLLDARAALRPDCPSILSAREHPLHHAGDARERRARGPWAEMIGTIRKEVATARLGSNITLAHVGPILRGEPFRVTR